MEKSKKQHELPSGWEIKSLLTCALQKGEYGINAGAVEYSSMLPRYIRITDIDDDGNFSNDKMVSVNDINSKNFLLEKGDIVFVRTGATVGKTYLYNEKDGKLVFAGFLIKFKPNSSVLLPNYLAFYTQTKKYWDWVKTVSMRSGQPGINAEELGNFNLVLPPLPEQRAIANILSTWDTAISLTQNLLAQKEQEKKWLMQELLTGKKRLKGFGGDWQEVKIGEIGEIQTGNTPSKQDPENWGNEFNWCTADDMKNKYIENTSQKLSPQGWKQARKVKADSVLVTCIASIGINAITKVETGFNQQINSITPLTNYNTEFVYYLIDFSRNKLMEFAGAGALPMLNKNTFMGIKFKFPEFKEQTAIASVLQTADKEIELLKAKLEQQKLQKKGLMQVLLTGEVRVPQFEG